MVIFKWLTYFAIKCPGFHRFDEEDVTVIVAGAVMASIQFKNRTCFTENDCRLILPNGVLINRNRFERIFGHNLTNLKFLGYQKLNELELTENEIAMLHPILLLSCDGMRLFFRYIKRSVQIRFNFYLVLIIL